MRVRFAPVLAVFALAGCGVLDHNSAKGPAAASADLAVMVVPQDALGIEGLELDAADSGPLSAGKAADETVDPKDTAKLLKHAGWMEGYELNYSDPKRAAALARGGGLIAAGTSVESFETDSAARERLVKEIRDYERFEGKAIQSGKLEQFDTFDAAVGDEAWGLHVVARVGKTKVYATGVLFRHGNLLGSASFVRADPTVERAAAIRLALTLDERIERRLSGELREAAVPLPDKPKHRRKSNHGKSGGSLGVKRFTLTAADLQPGAVAVGGSYRQHGNEYVREFRLPSGRLGAFRVFYVEARTEMADSAETAAVNLDYYSAADGARELARAFARRALRSSARNLLAGPLPTKGRDTAAIVADFDARQGAVAVVTVFVRSGRFIGAITAVGQANELNTQSVIALAPKLRAKLRAVR